MPNVKISKQVSCFIIMFIILAFGAREIALAATIYHGNTQSDIFHDSGCRYYNCKKCVVKFDSREKAISAGYRACKICKP